MTLIRDLNDLPDDLRGGAITIGNFDGVHLGHARIVERLVEQARQVGGAAVAFTFDPHPARLLRPDRAPIPLCWTERKAELLCGLGVDAVIAYPTDQAFLAMEAEDFFRQILRGRFAAKAIVEGPNFLFGRGRRGGIDMLDRLCDRSGVNLEVVSPIEVGGQIVSSTRVRQLVADGHIDEADRLLVEPHRVRGLVVHGAARGATLGYPTANLEPDGCLVPGEGIYAGRARVDGVCWPAAVSVGPNPTFDDGRMKIEAYLIGYDGWLYDRTIEVDFLSRLRDIVRFASVDDLLAQMARDVAKTRHIAEQYHCEGASS